ncbi:MAG: hypothetical protein KJO98_06280, partial [Rhodothermia bacterium]|nr:hypothetical protein [Rhodothermia bacterium]
MEVLLLPLLIVGIISTNGYLFPSANHLILVPPTLAILEPGLFAHDFFVQEMLGFPPRWFTYVSVFLLIKAGLTLPSAYLLIYVSALTAFLVALRSIASLISRSLLPAALLVFWTLAANAGDIGGVALFRNTPLPSTCATAISVWGVYFALQRSWWKAYAMFGAASVIQLLVGLLPAIMVGPLFLFDVMTRRQWRAIVLAAAAFIAAIGLVLVPMLLNGITGTERLTSRAFVELYAYQRVPHHLVPSSWPPAEWIEYGLFTLGGILCVSRLGPTHSTLRVALLTAILVSMSGLAANYIFVEVWPWAPIAKLHLARMTPFASLAILIGLLVLFVTEFRRGNWIACSIIAVAPVSILPGAILIVIAIFRTELSLLNRMSGSHVALAIAPILFLCLYRLPLILGPAAWPEEIVRGLLPVTLLITPFMVSRVVTERQARISWSAFLLASQLFLGLMLMMDPIRYPAMFGVQGEQPAAFVTGLVNGPLLLGVLALPYLLLEVIPGSRYQLRWAGLTSVVACCAILVGLAQTVPLFAAPFIQDRIVVNRQWVDSASRLALQFDAEAPTDALVLIPPSLEQFQLLAQRSV